MENETVYLLLDAAACGMEEIEAASIHAGTRAPCSLFLLERGHEHLSSVAPYLFTCSKNELLDWFRQNGWGKSWGIILESAAPPGDLLRHLRRFLRVKLEGRGQMFFRYYDPSVLRAFLPTCNSGQLESFFAEIRYFFTEDADPAFMLMYSFNNGELQTERIRELL